MIVICAFISFANTAVAEAVQPLNTSGLQIKKAQKIAQKYWQGKVCTKTGVIAQGMSDKAIGAKIKELKKRGFSTKGTDKATATSIFKPAVSTHWQDNTGCHIYIANTRANGLPWPIFCSTIVHEYGHLGPIGNGQPRIPGYDADGHSADPTNIMYWHIGYQNGTTNIRPECK